jgi:hypothetical protein
MKRNTNPRGRSATAVKKAFATRGVYGVCSVCQRPYSRRRTPSTKVKFIKCCTICEHSATVALSFQTRQLRRGDRKMTNEELVAVARRLQTPAPAMPGAQ